MTMRATVVGSWVCAVAFVAATAAAAPTAPVKTSLVEAARNGDEAAVRALLTTRTNVNAPEPDGTTALHWATSRNQTAIVAMLIKAGADVKLANRYGVTPLLLACENGSPAMVTALLAAGADPNNTMPEGETAVMVAARSGKTEIVKLLAAHGAKIDTRESWHGQTALMWAAAEGHSEVVKTLVELGADLRARTEGGFTPLLFASRAGKIDAVTTLLAAGADVNDALTPTAKAPAPKAMPEVSGAGNNAGVAREAVVRPAPGGVDGTSALMMALTNKHWTLAKLLIERGANPNDDRSGWTGLHELAYLRKPNVGKGLPPQEEVEHTDTLDVARALVEHGADVNARQTKERRDGSRNDLNRVGATPLILAAKHADVPLMKFLAEHGADPHLTTAEHASLLMVAAGVGIFNVGESAGTNAEAFEATKLAYELGSTDVNAADDGGWTALHGAAKRGSNEITQFLVEHGTTAFDATTKKEGWTALRIADGVFVGGTIKRADETAALIRKLMIERGLTPPAKVVNDVAEIGKAQP
jgi:ankyrin repeat protein